MRHYALLIALLCAVTLWLCFGCKKKGADAIPPNPPNAVCTVAGRWLHTPAVFIEPHAAINGRDPAQLVKDQLALMQAKTHCRYRLVDKLQDAEVEVVYYDQPWVLKQTAGVTSGPLPGGCAFVTELVSDKATSDATFPDWPAPDPQLNFAGMTYLRLTNLHEIVKGRVWLNLYPLHDGPGLPTAMMRTVLHEYGHLGGQNHATEMGRLMYPQSIAQPNWFTPAEQDLFDKYLYP